MEQSERELFAEAVAKVFDRAGSQGADAGLAEIGWRDALSAWGGPAISVVMGVEGRACATSSAVGDVLSAALGLGEPAAVLLPRLGSKEPPATVTGKVLVVDGVAPSRVFGAERAAVVVRGPGGCRVQQVPAELLTVEPIAGLDPGAHLFAVTTEVLTGDLEDGPEADWEQALALGQLALACELVGVGRAMLDLAIEHATSRVQFGRTIGTFQAVRHRLVDAFVALEGAAAAAEACCDSVGGEDAGDDGAGTLSPSHAAMAKALAGYAARTAAKHSQQVLAGMGFTAEHTFHHYLRRSMLLDRLLGSSRALTREIGQLTLAERRVPMDLPL